jgi:hypothetical protein
MSIVQATDLPDPIGPIMARTKQSLLWNGFPVGDALYAIVCAIYFLFDELL